MGVLRMPNECMVFSCICLYAAGPYDSSYLFFLLSEDLLLVAETAYSTCRQAQQHARGLSEHNQALMNENASLNYRLQILHASGGKSAVQQALVRRNKALETELQSLTEELNEHYVPVTVCRASNLHSIPPLFLHMREAGFKNMCT